MKFCLGKLDTISRALQYILALYIWCAMSFQELKGVLTPRTQSMKKHTALLSCRTSSYCHFQVWSSRRRWGGKGFEYMRWCLVVLVQYTVTSICSQGYQSLVLFLHCFFEWLSLYDFNDNFHGVAKQHYQLKSYVTSIVINATCCSADLTSQASSWIPGQASCRWSTCCCWCWKKRASCFLDSWQETSQCICYDIAAAG